MRWGALAMCVMTAPAFGLTYGARMDEAMWFATSAHTECRLAQVIPEYGEAAFTSVPGQQLAFGLYTNRPLMSPGIAHLMVEGVSWRPPMAARDLTAAASATGRTSILLNQEQSAEVLSALKEGHQIRVILRGWYAGDELDVVVSPVRLQESLDEFSRCLPKLALASKPKPVMVPHPPKQVASADARKEVRKESKGTEETAASGMTKDKDKGSAFSPSQEWIRHHEVQARGHLPKISRGKANNTPFPAQSTLQFPVGKSTLSKEAQDVLDAVFKEWQIRVGEGRTMSVKLESNGGSGLDDLAKERVTLCRAYLIRRGITEQRVHARVVPGTGSVDAGKVQIIVGD